MLPTALNIILYYIILYYITLFIFCLIFYLVCNYLVCNYLVCNFFFTKEESNADMLVSEQVGVAAMAVVSLRWSSRSASDHLVGVAGC